MSDTPTSFDDWEPVRDDDPLRDPPTEAPPYVADPLVDALPYRQLSWETFEKLLVRVADRVDGLRRVQRYGTRGQKQHGIDIVGWTESGDAHVLQGKDVQSFDENDLADAVETFRLGKRPFAPTRIIFGVAVPARRTQVVEGIEAAKKLLNIDVDLYHADRLDEFLRTRPEIVEEFFGKMVADRFCAGTAVPADATVIGIDPTVRAFAAGPIRALGLQDEEKRAFDLQDPAERARALLNLADKLSMKGWEPNARTLRHQARGLLAEAVRQSSSPDLVEELARLATSEALSALLGGEATSATSPARALAELVGVLAMGQAGLEVPPADLPDFDRWRSRALALLAATDALSEPFEGLSGSLPRLRQAVEQLAQDEDGYFLELAVILGELSIAAEAEPMSAALLNKLDIASARLLRGFERDRRLGARCACIVAEMRGQWTDVAEKARRSELDPWEAALVMARHARWCALAGRDNEATSSWHEATRWAGEAKLAADAASWMRCLIQARMREADFDPGVQDLMATAVALADRPSEERLTPEVDGEWREALGALANKPPDLRRALEPLVRIRWAYTASGDLLQEREVVTRLGDLLRSAGEYDEALVLYVRASAHKEVQALISGTGDRVLRVAAQVRRPLQDQRATAYLAIKEGGDLVPDEEVETIGVAVLADVVGVVEGTIRDTPFAPNLLTSAVGALAALGDRLPEEILLKAMKALEPSLDRLPQRYAWTDEAFCALVDRIAGRSDITQPIREEAARTLATAALVMPHVKDNLNDLLRLRREHAELADAIEAILLPAVAEGNRVALLILRDHPSARELVRHEAEAALGRVTSLPFRAPGQVDIGINYGPDAWLITTLDEDARLAAINGLIARASRTDDVLVNRQAALSVIPSLAYTLDEPTREPLFEQLIPFGRGERDEVAPELDFRLQHPLSAFQFNVGPSSLVSAGLRAASSCAVTDPSQAEVARFAFADLRSSGGAELQDLVTALATLAPNVLEPNLPLLAQDPRDDLRALAAVKWVQVPADLSIGCILARDRAPVVRRTLAANLESVTPNAEASDQRWAAWAEVLGVLSLDARASVRRNAQLALRGAASR